MLISLKKAGHFYLRQVPPLETSDLLEYSVLIMDTIHPSSSSSMYSPFFDDFLSSFDMSEFYSDVLRISSFS